MADVPQYTTVATPKDYWMSPRAISITRNARSEANRIAASVASGAQFFCHFEDIGDPAAEETFGYDVGHNFRSWPLAISPTYFNTNKAIYLHIAIPRTDRGDSLAMVVFPTVALDLWGYEVTDVPMQDEDGNYIDEQGNIVDDPDDAATAYVRKKKYEGSDEDADPLGSDEYYYIYLHGRLTSSGSGYTFREWDPEIDTGRLNTDETWGEVITIEQLAKEMKKKVDVEWFQRIFTIHGTGRKRHKDPDDDSDDPDWERDDDGNIIYSGDDDERREIKPNDMDHEITDTESMFGTWTEQFLSALGIGSGGGGGGGGGDALDEPLLSINQMVATPTQQQIGYTLVWKGNNAGINNSGWDFGQAGMSRQEIQTLCDSLYLKLNSPSTPQTVTSDITLTGNLTINRTPITDFTGKENYVLTLRETETYFGNKYVRVDWFKKVFETYTGTTKHDPNDAGVIAGTTVLNNLKILVGTWTEQYLSALGIGSGGGGGGAGLDDPLLSINAIGHNPSEDNQTLVWKNNQWTFGSAGLDENALGQYLTTNKYLNETGLTAYKWWGQQFSANNKTIKGKIEVEGNIEKVHHIIPLNNNLYTIGNSNYRFNAIYVNEIYVGDAKISWDSTNHGLHLTKGAYTDEWLAALGAGSGGSGGGGIDLEAMWDSLSYHTDTYGSAQIDLAHLADLQTWASQNFNNYTLPKASANTLGGIKVGSGLSINSSTGVLSRDALSASDITSGTFDAARIPDLSGTYVTNTAIAGYKWWGQKLDSGVVKGDIFMLSTEEEATLNTNSAKLKFNSASADSAERTYRSPYIQAIPGYGGYGKKRLSVFQSDASDYVSDFAEVLSILPSGNIGIGVTSPDFKLEVGGTAKINNLLTLYREGTTEQNNPAGVKFSVKDTTTGQTYTSAYIVAYQDHGESSSSGVNFVMRGGGNIFLGGGEAPSAHYSEKTAETTVLTGEHLFLTTDGATYIQSGAGTVANRKGICITSGGHIVPCEADVLTDETHYVGTRSNRFLGMFAKRYYFIKPNSSNDNGAVYLEYDSQNGGVHIAGAGLYADSYVSSLGTGSGGGAVTGIDWEALETYDGQHTINTQYLNSNEVALTSWVNSQNFLTSIPTASSTVLGGVKVGSGLSISNGVLSRSALTASDIPDLSSTYVTKTNGVTAIVVGTDGNANKIGVTKNGSNTGFITVPYSTKAGSLSDTAAYSAFGQTFFNNGLPVSIPVTAKAQMQVAFFTETDGTTKAGYVGRGGTSVNTVFLIGYSGNEVDLGANGNQGHIHINTSGNVGIGTTSPQYALDVSGDIHTSGDSYIDSGKALICKISSSSTKKLLEFDGTQVTLGYGFRSSNETRIYGKNIGMYYGTTLKVQVTTDGLKIGDITIKNENGGLHVIGGGLYTDTFLSALGTGSGGSVGSGMTEDQMWVALGTDGQTQQITLNHLSLALNGYATQAWVQQQGYLTSGDVVTRTTDQTISGAKTFTSDVRCMKSDAKICVCQSQNGSEIKKVGLNSDTNRGVYDFTESKWLIGNDGSKTFLMLGNVGIGTTNPVTKLHVDGAGYFTGSVGIGGVDQDHGLYVSGKTRLAGNVGIGTTASDSYKLSVSGSVNFAVSSGMNVTFSRESYGYDPSTGTLYEIVMKTDYRFYLDTPSSPLYRYNWASHSDIRYKNILHNIDIDVENIARAPIFDFSWKNEKNGIVSVGTSAQYWKPLLPNAVTVDKAGKLYMDYSATALAAAVMTARKVMDHEERIAALEAENKSIKAENEQLRHEIELLKAA